MQDERGFPLLRAEVGITRAHRQAISFAHDRANDDLDRQIQVSYHAVDDGGLSCIFLSEEGHVRFDDVEELGDNRGHATEVSRTRLAEQLFTKTSHRAMGAGPP